MSIQESFTEFEQHAHHARLVQVERQLSIQLDEVMKARDATGSERLHAAVRLLQDAIVEVYATRTAMEREPFHVAGCAGVL